MLELDDISIIIDSKNRPLIKKFSFVLNKGDKVAIIGEEGNGKSTLLKYIVDKSQIESYCRCEGRISCHGSIGYLDQFLDEKWNNQPVINYFLKDNPDDEILIERYNYYGDIVKNLANVGIKENLLDDDYYISYLSGGEKVKIQLAKLLFQNKDILLLDEPTNDLDIATLKWLENFINEVDKPIMYVSHDETLLENTANTIIHLEQIKRKSDARHTIAKMGYKEYVEARLNQISNQNQQAAWEKRNYQTELKTLKEIKNKVQKANPGRTNRMNALLAQEKRLNEENRTMKADVEEAIGVNFNDVSIPNGKTILDLNLPVLTNGDKVLSFNISLKVVGPEHLVIIGENGVGKSTLMKYIYEILKTRQDIKVGYMPQNYNDLLLKYETPLKFLKSKDIDENIARTFMGSMKFTSNEMLGKIEDLSGGQKAKLLLIKLILDNCNVLLLDEPTRNLSPLSNPVIRNILNNYKGTIISISHDRKFIQEVGEVIYTLDQKGLKSISIN